MNPDRITENLSLVVVGASGDLARKKILPALFSLYCQGYLPEHFHVFGFARTEMSHEIFRNRVKEHLTCRYVPGEKCGERIQEFLDRCYYTAGQYDSSDSFLDLYTLMKSVEKGRQVNRMFDLAVPPSIFQDTVHAIGNAGLVSCGQIQPWSRVVIEKPFGRDRASSDKLTRDLARVFAEEQIYRIDHYLGKEVVQNLMVLRFANLVFEPVWNKSFVESVSITWKENIGVDGRGGYFDDYGIIRDVMQNHLMQILALVAMESPGRFEVRSIAREKIRVLKAIPPATLNQIVVGQYTGATRKGQTVPSYVDNENIPTDSLTPTYAAALLHIHNPRWKGVPFLLTAGKGLEKRVNEIRMKFKPVPRNIFCNDAGCPPANELIIRIQPDEAILLRIINKQPGLDMKPVESKLNLEYQAAFNTPIPEAYECLLLDVIQGDKSLFIRAKELAAAWNIFTPVLHALEKKKIRPVPYPFGSNGPALNFRGLRV